MAVLKTDPLRHAKPQPRERNPLARVMRDFDDLVLTYETCLLRSTDPLDRKESSDERRARIRHHACRLAMAELSSTYTRKHIRRSLHAAESLGKTAEERLHSALDAGEAEYESNLDRIHHGHFRLYSTELFDTLGQPTDLRFGTLRFRTSSALGADTMQDDSPCASVELALNSSFFVADSSETLPYHSFNMPESPSLINRGILSRKPEDGGAFPEYDSWLLFTFLGNGCLKVEIPVEMCADVYGGNLRGRENEEVIFWGVFVDDEAVD